MKVKVQAIYFVQDIYIYMLISLFLYGLFDIERTYRQI